MRIIVWEYLETTWIPQEQVQFSKWSYQGLLEYFLKYSGLQTLALLSIDSTHILI